MPSTKIASDLVKDIKEVLADQELTRGGVQAMLSVTEGGGTLPADDVAPAIRALLIIMESLPADADQ